MTSFGPFNADIATGVASLKIDGRPNTRGKF
jgi:hypothetical protein